MKNKSLNQFLFLAAVLVVLFSFTSFYAQINQTNQKNDSSKQLGSAVAIDTSPYDKEIEIATQILKKDSQKKANKKNLAAAYAARGFALVNAAQYKSALGDLRRCLNLDPKNKRAKKMHNQIIGIYKSMDIEPPEEGKEPLPLPFNKN